jgi:hypothetical protein
MNSEDRAAAAKRLQDDPLATEYLDTIEKAAIEDMIAAKTDEERRQHRDTVRAVRAFRSLLDMEIQRHAESRRPPPAVA